MLTGIGALDLLVFGDPYGLHDGSLGAKDAGELKDRGFLPGEVVLLRGEPGSGKTTLALQIASNVLGTGVGALFITVEESKASLTAKQRAFFPDATEMLWMGREEVVELIRPQPTEALDLGSAGDAVVDGAVGAVASVMPESAPLGLALSPLAKAAFRRFFQAVSAKLSAMADEKRTRRLAGELTGHGFMKPDLLVIDSLNAFMNLILTTYPGHDPRLLLGTICERLRSLLGNENHRPVIVVTGEYHFHGHFLDRHLPESFFCDTEIVLRTEPLRTARHQTVGEKVTLGYELSALVEDNAKSVESRSFCRVLKCRSAPNQSRRCAYDIGENGLRFFETYPGDGKLLLFAENEQQRERWQSFLHRDMTDAYPALRYELFTMRTLQSVYESTRRLGHVPLRTDMFLASLDSYWVTGYRDYRLKRLINDSLQQSMKVHGKVDPFTLFDRQPPTDDETPGGPLMTRQSRAIQYPMLVNDLLGHYLLKLEQGLYAGTHREIVAQFLPKARSRSGARSRRDLVGARAEACEEEASSLSTKLAQRYDPLCRDLFGAPVEDVLAALEAHPSLRQTFLRPLPRSKLQLFGQYDGSLLSSLRREDMHEYVGHEDHWICVPYDANIGIFVVRKDLFERVKATTEELRSALTRLKERELDVWKALANDVANGEFDALFLDVGALHAVRRRVEVEKERCEAELEEARNGAHPALATPNLSERLTWDQVLCFSAARGTALGIETRTFDTMMALFLELIWNCGGRLNVSAAYEIEKKEELVVPLALALHYFSAIFDLTDTARSQTVDPGQFDPTDRVPYGEWIFSRFWYSTLVDAVTAKTADRDGGFVWQSSKEGKVSLEIVQMPRGPGQQDIGHFACWGEWSFALLSGSENVELACDLVSNLMGALKVSDRGLRGAALPTVTQFYQLFGDQRCIPGDLREDLELPRTTFESLRKTYLEPTMANGERIAPEKQLFRQYIFDYRHCARAVYAELLRLKDAPDRSQGGEPPATMISNATRGVLTNIERLRESYLFIGDRFRHDVIQTEQYKNVRRTPRFVASIEGAQVYVGEQAFDSRILDLSVEGCRIESDAKLEHEGRLALSLGLGARRVPVDRVWSGPAAKTARTAYGLKFLEPLPRREWWKFVTGVATGGAA